MAIKEPYVKITEQIIDYPSVGNIDDSSLMAGVINAPCGPDHLVVQGPKQFLEQFTVDGLIPRNADPTLINAYFCSFFAPIVVKRSWHEVTDSGGNTGVPVLSGNFGSTPTSKLVGIGNFPVESTTDNISMKYPIDAEIVLSSPTSYNLAFDNTDTTNKYKDVIYLVSDSGSASTVGDAKLNWTSVNGTIIGNEPYIVIRLTEDDGTTPSGAYADGSYIADDYNKNGRIEVNYDGTIVAGSGTSVVDPGDPDSALLTIKLVEAGSATYEVYMDLSDTFKITVINTQLPLIMDPVIKPEFKLVSVAKWNTTYASTFNSEELSNIDSTDEADNELAVLLWYDTNVSLDEDTFKGYRLVSMIDTGLNPLTSKSVYWKDVLDSDSLPFVADLSNLSWSAGLDETLSLITTNKDDYNDYLSTNSSDFKNALNYFSDESDVYNISYLEDFGYNDIPYKEALSELADKNYWFYIFNIPDYLKSINSIIGTGGAVESLPETYRTMVAGGNDRTAAVTPWRSLITTSSLVWQRIYANKSSNSEFAPIFDITNGTLSVSKLSSPLNKTDRETLLSNKYPINWIKYDRTNQAYYLNDNRTWTRKQNVMNEEMNVRMMNKIARDIQLLLPRFKGLINNSATRLDCKSLIENYLNQSIMSQNYRPVEYLVVCDESNNTDAVINSNKLAVTVYIRLQGSIKYIEVLNKIYPLGVAFES